MHSSIASDECIMHKAHVRCSNAYCVVYKDTQCVLGKPPTSRSDDFFEFSILEIIFREKMPDDLQNKAGVRGQPLFRKTKKIIQFCGRRLPLNTDVVLLARGCSITCSMYWRPRPPWCNSTTLVPNLSIELKNKYHKITIFFTHPRTFLFDWINH